MSQADQAELAALCATEYARLVGSLRLFVGDAGVAQELGQDALLKLCEHWPKIRGHDRPVAWLYAVAFNGARSWRRRWSAERRAYARAVLLDSPPPDANDAVAVRAAIAELPLRQRQAVILRYFLDLTPAEAAAVMSCADGTVRALTSQGLAALRRSAHLNREELAFHEP